MKMLKTKIVPAAVVAAVLGLSVVSAHSMSTGNADADKRIATMKELGGNMKDIAGVAKGEAAYTPALNKNAERVNEIAKMLPSLFLDGSDTETDRAKPEIWTKTAEFAAAAKEFEGASEALVTAVATGDQDTIGAALGSVGKTCGGCHKPFRVPKD